MVGITSVLQFLYPTAVPFVDYQVQVTGADEHITFWNTGSLGAQPSEGFLATTQASGPYLTYVSAPAVLQRARDAAAAAVETDTSAKYKALRGAAAVLVDEINLLRQRDRDRADDVAASTSLADLKTRWAARAALNDRTLAQAKNAIEGKITAGVVD